MGLSTPLDIELLYPSYLRMPDANSFKTSKTSLPWMSIGYEMALTPLHVLTFYNAVANNGIMMKPIFTTSILSEGLEIVRKSPHVINSSICSKKTVKKVLPLLIGVVNSDHGTARVVRSEQYQIAGKTGTTVLNYTDRDKIDYQKEYQASFAGFFPANNPKYSCIVVVSKPISKYGSKVAAPIFKDLSDKVFAFDIELQNSISEIDLKDNFPDIMEGES